MSTKKKALPQSSVRKALQEHAKPPLAMAYENAVKLVCKKQSRVGKDKYERFNAVQSALDEAQVEYDEYAYAVVKSWWGWCRDKMGWKTVPINVFLGEKAIASFNKYMESTVRLETTVEAEFNAQVAQEVNAATLYIATKAENPTSAIIMKDCRRMTGYKGHTSPEILEEAVRLLADMYDCKHATCLTDIAMHLRKTR